MSVRIDGLAELNARIAALPRAFRDEVEDALETGAAIIESEAKGRVPVDEGDLLASIRTETKEGGLEVKVGSDLLYSKFVELGTVDTPAQPYLYPAYRWGARYVRRVMKEWATKAGQKVRARTRRRR